MSNKSHFDFCFLIFNLEIFPGVPIQIGIPEFYSSKIIAKQNPITTNFVPLVCFVVKKITKKICVNPCLKIFSKVFYFLLVNKNDTSAKHAGFFEKNFKNDKKMNFLTTFARSRYGRSDFWAIFGHFLVLHLNISSIRGYLKKQHFLINT